MSSINNNNPPPASLAMSQPIDSTAPETPAAPPVPQPDHQQPQPTVAEPSPAAKAAAALPDPASTALPPPPAVPLPQQIALPAKLNHADSASSVVAEPPTPLPVSAAATPAPNGSSAPVVNGAANSNGSAPVAEMEENASTEVYNTEAERAVEHNHAHPGLGMYPAGGEAVKPGELSGAVDVLADVAMGEAALGLADFASGAGSGDVKEGSPAVPLEASAAGESPSLKRSAPDESGDYMSAGTGNAGPGESSEDREAKRLKVEPDVRSLPPLSHSLLPFTLAHCVVLALRTPLLRRLLPSRRPLRPCRLPFPTRSPRMSRLPLLLLRLLLLRSMPRRSRRPHLWRHQLQRGRPLALRRPCKGTTLPHLRLLRLSPRLPLPLTRLRLLHNR